MQAAKSNTRIYGFEDYNIIAIDDSYFCGNWTHYLPWGFEARSGSYIINKNLAYNISEVSSPSYSWSKDIVFTPDICYNHSELLETAKKIYVHPSCKLSRSMMAEKYKKSLNPYLSDAIVIPNPDLNDVYLIDTALFINENAKLIVRVTLDDDHEEALNKLKAAEMGTKLLDLLSCTVEVRSSKYYKLSDLLNAELMFVGQILYVPNSQNWIMDILTNKIPTDKIVFEKSVQESLGCSTNQLDFDSLLSIHDMLNSSDEDNVSAGLKALSMMDWMHYSNSIKYIMNQADKYKWVYNKAMNSTSVKFMMKSIAPNIRSRGYYPGKYDDEIYEQDYELFKQLKMHYDKVQQDNILEYLRFMNFMTVKDGFIVPNLKS